MKTKLEAHAALSEALDTVKRVFASHVGSDKLPLTEDQRRYLIQARQALGATLSQLEDQMAHPRHYEDLQ